MDVVAPTVVSAFLQPPSARAGIAAPSIPVPAVHTSFAPCATHCRGTVLVVSAAVACGALTSSGRWKRSKFSTAAGRRLGLVARRVAGLPVRIETRGVPVLMYAPVEEVEETAREQLISLAESPLPVDHVAAMPDVHMGKGVAIGAVFASEKYVCPNAVGVDIGCGMCAVPVEGLFRESVSQDDLRRMQKLIKERIPTAADSHSAALPWAIQTLDNISEECRPTRYLAKRLVKEEKVARQLGTLGGGNHFIELVYDEAREQVWCMLHSGSRHIGNTFLTSSGCIVRGMPKSTLREWQTWRAMATTWWWWCRLPMWRLLSRWRLVSPHTRGSGNSVATHYDSIAGEKGTMLRGNSGSLNYLEIDSAEGQDYLKDMTWCQAYARENRRSMMQLMVETVEQVTGRRAQMDRAVNAHHNFCQCEKCLVKDPVSGRNVEKKLWVTRKGATSARPGEYGIIPGSMGTGSYIVKGKGAVGSFQSCSHGAGRRMSRTQARKQIPQEDFVESMKGVVCDTVAAVRDEAPQAYKDLSQVIGNQQELVDVEHRLLPMLNVKGIEEKGTYGRRRRRR